MCPLAESAGNSQPPLAEATLDLSRSWSGGLSGRPNARPPFGLGTLRSPGDRCSALADLASTERSPLSAISRSRSRLAGPRASAAEPHARSAAGSSSTSRLRAPRKSTFSQGLGGSSGRCLRALL